MMHRATLLEALAERTVKASHALWTQHPLYSSYFMRYYQTLLWTGQLWTRRRSNWSLAMDLKYCCTILQRDTVSELLIVVLVPACYLGSVLPWFLTLSPTVKQSLSFCTLRSVFSVFSSLPFPLWLFSCWLNCHDVAVWGFTYTFACRLLPASAGHPVRTRQSLMWVPALGTDVFDATCRGKALKVTP